MEKLSKRRQIWAWALYDWANSAFATIVLTFVFSAYFVKAVAPDPNTGAAWWSYALAASGLGLVVLGPLCGSIADHLGRLKLWTGSMMMICVVSTLFLWFAIPNAPMDTIWLVLGALILANIGFELSIVFNNALLPFVAGPSQLGRVSSLAWGVGYFGGLTALVLVLFGLIGLGDIRPWLTLSWDEAEHIRASVVATSLWYVLFSIPFFLLVRDRPAPPSTLSLAIRKGIVSLKANLLALKTDRVWRNFLIGSALYRDGLATLFALGGVYAAARYNLQTSDILLFGIGINVTAGLGCLIASMIEDRIGSLRTVRWSLIGLILLGTGVLLAPDKTIFFVFALGLGVFVGPVQSASRTMVARISSAEDVTERYGFYALTGRAIAFLGPLCFGLATDLLNTQVAGMATILLFWLAGFMLVRKLGDVQ